MGHSGSVNVSATHTRHALLNRYHPTRRLEPLASDEKTLSTLERANSARFLSQAFGVGRCMRPATPPATLNLPWRPSSHPLAGGGSQPQRPPVTTAFYLHGVWQLWSAATGAADGTAIKRWFSDDLTVWRAVSNWEGLPPTAQAPLASLAFHHYELEAVLALTDAKGVCWLFESSSTSTSQQLPRGATKEEREEFVGGTWQPTKPFSCHKFAPSQTGKKQLQLSICVPFNAYEGYPSSVAVGQCLYHIFNSNTNELRCSWGGPAKRIGGNRPADGDWEPTVQELLSKAQLPCSESCQDDVGDTEAGTSVALRASRPIISFVAGARWGDSVNHYICVSVLLSVFLC